MKNKTTAITATKKGSKTDTCRQYYIERTRINEELAILKDGLYVDVDGLLVVGERVVFDIDGKLCAVKKSPATKGQVSQVLLKEKKALTKWRELQDEAQALQKKMDVLQDQIAVVERGCLIRIEAGYQIKTLANPDET